MGDGLTEVVYRIQLPHGALAQALGKHGDGRITLTPLTHNGTGYPTRFLVSATGQNLNGERIAAALDEWFDDRRVLRQDGQTLDEVGTLKPHLQDAIAGTLLEATGGPLGDVIYRPLLIRGGWAYANVVCPDETRCAEVVARLTQLLKGRGLDGHLVRLHEHRTDRQAPIAYDEALTPKQSEILRVALALGLYDTPRRCTLDTLADIFGISKAAAHNRMKGAERKVLTQYFG